MKDIQGPERRGLRPTQRAGTVAPLHPPVAPAAPPAPSAPLKIADDLEPTPAPLRGAWMTGSQRVGAWMIVAAGVASFSAQFVPVLSTPVPLFVAGAALAIAGALLISPSPRLLLGERGLQIAFLLLGLSVGSYVVHAVLSPSVVLTLVSMLAVIAPGWLAPTNPVLPFLSLTALLAGHVSATAGMPEAWELAPLAVVALTQSVIGSRLRSTHSRLEEHKARLERDLDRLRDLYDRTAAPAHIATTIAAAAADFASASAPNEIAERVARQTRTAVQATGTILVLWDGVHETLRIGAMAGPPESAGGTELRQVEMHADAVPTLRGRPAGEPVAVEMRAFREPVLQSLLKWWKAGTVFGIRLQREDQLQGVLFVVRSEREAALSPREVEILHGIATHAAAALAHAQVLADLQAATALKEEFMNTMSHELRTPLNVIIGYTDLQLEGVFGDIDGEHRDAVQRTREQALQLLELIQATLDMGRLERGLVGLEIRDVAISDFMDGLRAQIPPTWKKPTVEVNWPAMPKLPTIRTDAAKLQLLLRNVIHNAFKFTQQGSVTVAVAMHPSRERLSFIVQDTGIGIKAEHLSGIFEMFRQLPQADSLPGGVGLGLYIVRRLAAALGAEIEISSAPGRGTTFRVHVPTGGPLARSKTASKEGLYWET